MPKLLQFILHETSYSDRQSEHLTILKEKWFEQLFTDMLGKVICGIEEATSLEVSPACSKWIGCKPDGTCGDQFVC